MWRHSAWAVPLLAAGFVAGACADGGDTVPGVPTTVGLTSEGEVPVAESATDVRDVLVSGAQKLSAVTERDERVTHVPAGADATMVGRARYRDDVTLDVYYPPEHDFDGLLPAVVFVNAWSTTEDTILFFDDGTPMDEALGTADFQNSNSYTTTANLVAASGLAVVVYGTADDPRQDLDDAMTWLTANATDLGIDGSRLAAWMWSAHTLTGLPAVMAAGGWADDVRCAVVYYGWMTTEPLRDDVTVQVVRAMDDEGFFLLSQLDFLVAADVGGTPVELVEVQAPHAFDREPGYEELTVETLETTLEFLDRLLAPG